MQQLLRREDVQALLQSCSHPLRKRNLKSAPLRGNPLLPFNTPTPGEEKSWVARVSIDEQLAGMRKSPVSFELSDLSWSSNEADSMIDSELNLSAATRKRLQEDIQSQKEKLGVKLKARIKRMSRPSGDFTLTGLPECSENRPYTDRGSASRDTYEEQVETLLEQFVINKAELIAVINNKYDEQVREMEAAGNSGIVAKVIVQMRAEQAREVKEAVEELEARRKVEIAALRKHLFQRDGSCC